MKPCGLGISWLSQLVSASSSLLFFFFLPSRWVIWGRSATLIAIELLEFLLCQCCITEWNSRLSWTRWQCYSREGPYCGLPNCQSSRLLLINLLLPRESFIILFTRADLDSGAMRWITVFLTCALKITKYPTQKKKKSMTICHPAVFTAASKLSVGP